MRFDMSGITSATEAEGFLFDVKEVLHMTSEAAFEACINPNCFDDPSVIHYAASKITGACAHSIDHLLSEGLITGSYDEERDTAEEA